MIASASRLPVATCLEARALCKHLVTDTGYLRYPMSCEELLELRLFIRRLGLKTGAEGSQTFEESLD